MEQTTWFLYISLHFLGRCCIIILQVTAQRNVKKFLLTPRIYGPLTAFDSLIKDAHSSLPTVFCRHLLTFVSRGSSPTSLSHLILGLPVLLPSDLVSNIFLTLLPWSILTKSPVPSNNTNNDKKFINHSFKLFPFHFIIKILCKSKSKAIPLQAWTGPEGSRRLRLPYFKKIGTCKW